MSRKKRIAMVAADQFQTWEVIIGEVTGMVMVPKDSTLQEVLWSVKKVLKLPPDTHGDMFFEDAACTKGQYISKDKKHKFTLRRLDASSEGKDKARH